MSGQKVILLMFAGVLIITALTLGLYLTTRQLDGEGPEQAPESRILQIDRRAHSDLIYLSEPGSIPTPAKAGS